MEKREMEIQVYSIKDLEEISGIKAHTIRIWEKRYNMFEPGRTNTNIRYYSDNDLKKLLNISILLDNNYKISQIAHFSPEEVNKKVARVCHTFEEKTDPVEKLIIAMIDYDQTGFENIVHKSVQKAGFEKTVEILIYPLFTKVGFLWQTEAINPAQEHFVSNLIKKLFFAEIDKLQEPEAKKPSFLLFLHDNEQHELGLLYTYYLLKKEGFRVIYLGQSVPLNDLIKAWSSKKSDFIVTSFTTNITAEKLAGFLDKLSEKFPDVNILCSGVQTKLIPDYKKKNIKILTDFYEFKKLLTNL